MSVKVNVGLAKKIGQPDYGSLGATCNVEFDLDGGFDNGSTSQFQDAVRRAYIACRQAVEAELGCAGNEPESTSGSNRIGGQHTSPGPQNGHGHGNGNGNGHAAGHSNGATRSGTRMATSSQVRAIHAIANRNCVDLPGLLSSRYATARPEDLSISDASLLIDEMKGANGSPGTTVSR